MELTHRTQLMDFVNELKLYGAVAELGVAEGHLSLEFLKAGASHVYMIDNWGKIENVRGDGNFPQVWHDYNYGKAMERIEPYKERVTILRGLTKDMAQYVPDESLALLYLDAAHDYASVLSDLQEYFPKVIDGGVISGHDFINPAYGVKEAVEDFCRDRFEVHVIPENAEPDAGFWFIKK